MDITGFKAGLVKLQAADQVLGIKMAVRLLSAITRDGNKIEINHADFPEVNIADLNEWVCHNGAGDFDYDGHYISFESIIDADLFWLSLYRKDDRLSDGMHFTETCTIIVKDGIERVRMGRW